MLTDLFVDPAAHGSGTGRAILEELWNGIHPRMTFSSLHANALPLYTSFGVDAWWPLLYLRGDVGRLEMPPGWSVTAAEPEHAAALERDWTGVDRTADYRFWSGWPAGIAVLARLDGAPAAAGTTGGAGPSTASVMLRPAPPWTAIWPATLSLRCCPGFGHRMARQGSLARAAPRECARCCGWAGGSRSSTCIWPQSPG